MKKLYDKDPVWFAVYWIIAYVVSFSTVQNLLEGAAEYGVLCGIGAVITAAFFAFAVPNGLLTHFGFAPVRGSAGRFLYFLPLVVIGSVNLWFGITLEETGAALILAVLQMCFVGFLEEVLFRGLLFRGMAQSNVKTAVIVSSVTFGIGHLVNLLNGAPVLDTMCQLVYACAIGFAFTMTAWKSGSLIPCILCHIAVDVLSLFGVDPGPAWIIPVSAVLTVVAVAYGVCLLKLKTQDEQN